MGNAMLAELKFRIACAQFKAGQLDAGTLAAYAAKAAGYALPGTEDPRARRECAARTAALARWSRVKTPR